MSRHPRKRRPQLPGQPVTLGDGHAYTLPTAWQDLPKGYPQPLADERDAVTRDLLNTFRTLAALDAEGLEAHHAPAHLVALAAQIIGINYELDAAFIDRFPDLAPPDAVEEILSSYLDRPRFQRVAATLDRIGIHASDLLALT